MEVREKIKILLADDHQIVRDGINMLLSRSEDIEVVYLACNGKDALAYIKRHPIDLLLTDISMPEMDGIELTRKVKQEFDDVSVLILSMHDDTSTVSEAIHAEADGYILKNTGKRELEAAIHKIIDGGTYYSSDIVSIIMKGLQVARKKEHNTKPLSDRELEVLRLVCDELTTPEIAERLFISPKTVETHRKNILRKTGVKSIIGLMKFAIANRIVDWKH